MSSFNGRLVTTWAALTVGVAAVVLPFAYRTSPREATFAGELWPLAIPFYLAIVIGLSSLPLTRSALALARIRVAGWAAAAASGAMTTYFFLSSMLREAPSQPWDWFGVAVLLAVAVAAGVLVPRVGRGRRSVVAMQVAYAANALWCLIVLAGEWQSGAWCALATVLIYVVQIGAVMRSTDGAAGESGGRPVPSALGTLVVMAVATASISASSCGESPTQPSQEDRIAIYSGQWRAELGDCQVVIQLHAVRGGLAPALDGTGTAVSRTTGEISRLKIYGSGTMSDDLSSSGSFSIALADEELPGGGWRPGPRIGWFIGLVAPDRRTWTGRYRAWEGLPDFVDIFGVQDVPATFTKD